MADDNTPGSFAQQNEDANHGIYEPGSFGAQNAQANRRLIPQVDPIQQTLAIMRRKAAATSVNRPGLPPPGREHEFDVRLTALEELMTSVITSLNGATIEAVCNEDTTITVTLTIPNLPGA